MQYVVAALLAGLALSIHPAEAQTIRPGSGPGAGLMTLLDTDKDGIVTRPEYDTYRAKIFSAMDKDADGTVDRAEFDSAGPGRGPKRAGGPMPGRSARFDRLDANKDGKLTATEHAAETRDMFARRDANKDGKLTADEMGPMRRGGPPR